MIKERLEDNETLQQLPPELFLVLEARKKKRKVGRGAGRSIYFGAVSEAEVSAG